MSSMKLSKLEQMTTSTESSYEECNYLESSKNIGQHENEDNLNQISNGDMCLGYLPLSSSSVFRHPYYSYPGVVNPGIVEALLQPEPRIIYSDDGQELYLALCKKMGLSPISIFYKKLLEEHVNLKYYGVSPMSFLPIAISLKNNKYVKTLDLTDNWISTDGCFHLGDMLIENITLQELNLSGCRIGPVGARQLFAGLQINRSLRKIDLTKNCLEDVGVTSLAKAIVKGSDITDINLCYNELTSQSLLTLVEAFETYNKLTHLDLSWNSFLSPNAIFSLCAKLSENKELQELNLSWTAISGLRVGKAIKNLLTNPNIKSLNLSNNKLSSVEIKHIAKGLEDNKGLKVLDISNNPLTPKDAFILLICLKDRKVKVQKLFLDNVFVTIEFLVLRQEILSLKYRQNAIITWGGLITKFVPTVGDMREIVLKRADAICSKSKKKVVDIVLIILEMFKANKEPIDVKQFTRTLRINGIYMDEGLLDELCNAFTGPPGTGKTIDLVNLVDYLKRLWPDRQLPPTPPIKIDKPTENVKKNRKTK
ncbi:leucine-rich repeat-containing protein 74B-like [Vanessa tameamea]|uniref:Leucine-rich repeat-containing protein 74B-like n=1 Tax=Vanessa tameamea TaxID=334116 RepID=A0ABM4AKE0_VANTA